MGKASRDKGRRGEQATARELRAAFPEALVRRGMQSRDGADEPDVIVELDGEIVLAVEVKTWSRRPSWGDLASAYAQAEATAERVGCRALAVIRENRRKPVVVMRSPVDGELDVRMWLPFLDHLATKGWWW